jgi:hypothetical protein
LFNQRKSPVTPGFFVAQSNIKPAYPQIKIKDYSATTPGAMLLGL